MAKINKLYGYEIIDSRGIPTIEAKLELDSGQQLTTAAPSGISKGAKEAWELRDDDSKRFNGLGVSQSVSYINSLISPKLLGTDPSKQIEIDNWLISADGTKNKSKLGANTILVVSQLIAKASAVSQELPLFKYINSLYNKLSKSQLSPERIPWPIFNIINGGKHSNNSLQFQEYQIIPSSSLSFSESYQTAIEIFYELKKVLQSRNSSAAVGEEGGLSTNLPSNLDSFDVINEAIVRKNLKAGLDVFIGSDIAASHFFSNDRYSIRDKPHPLNRDEFIDFLMNLVKNYAVLALEDPLYEEDWSGWKKLMSVLPNSIYLVGDDLICTNKERLLTAIKEKACSGVIIKPNQIGTISEALEVVSIAKKNNICTVVSHRSGESNDDFIADFAVGVQADFCKFGAPCRGERVAKYNRLWNIERHELQHGTWNI